MSRRQALIETAVVFAVFFLQGAWPVPDVNEPYYLGKAIHFWNPAWAAGDAFLQSADSHRVFYWTLGWMSLVLGPTALAWTLRTITWALLAWAWRRLSVALVPRPWFAPLTATIFLFLVQHYAVAGEWVVGGAEAKGFAYVLVLLGLEALVRGQWNRTWLYLGAASAMHVLVGGWSALAAGIAWMVCRWEATGWRTVFRRTPINGGQGTMQHGRPLNSNAQACPLNVPSLRSMAAAIAGGLLLAALGLIPAIALDWHADRAEVGQAHEIYVFLRFPHHLDPFRFPAQKVVLFLLLAAEWLLLAVVWLLLAGRRRGETTSSGAKPQAASGAFTWFVHATLLVAVAGLGLRVLGEFDRGLAAGLLRFYWFRLADVAVPLGVTFLGVALVAQGDRLSASRFRHGCLAAMILLAVLHVADCVVLRLFAAPPFDERVPDLHAWGSALAWLGGRGEGPIFPRQPRADRMPGFPAWKEACTWIAESGRIPAGARFLTPRMSQTFKWYAHRAEVATWKEAPQDAAELVRWWDRIEDLYATGREPPEPQYHASLAELGAERLRQLAGRYDAQYVITEATEPPVGLPIVFQNRAYVVYRLQ
jgi:hypothetical protein